MSQIVCRGCLKIKDFNDVKNALRREGIILDSAKISWIPNRFVELDETIARKTISLVEALENHDDVRSVYANFNVTKNLLSNVKIREEKTSIKETFTKESTDFDIQGGFLEDLETPPSENDIKSES